MNNKDKDKESPESWWGLGILAIMLILIISIWLSWPSSPPDKALKNEKKMNTSTTVVPQTFYNLCAVGGEYDFSNLDVKKVGKVDVFIRQDCWTKIVLPMGICWRTSPEIDVVVLLPNGEKIIDGPGRITPGINNIRFFSVKALSQPGTMPIIFDGI